MNRDMDDGRKINDGVRSAEWAEEAVRENRVGVESRGNAALNITKSEVLERIELARSKRPRLRDERITLAHGAGGKATHTLVDALFVEAFRNPILEKMEDQASFNLGGARLAFTTDSFVVSPLFFPGGNIGDLAVNGTVNDLAVGGARPLYLSPGFFLEEGFSVADLRKFLPPMQAAPPHW